MNENINDMMNQFSTMLQKNELPEEFKQILNSLKNDCNNNTNSEETSTNSDKVENNSFQSNENFSNSSQNFDFNFSNIDINTILKLKSLINSINNDKNDPRTNLLKSLKPYLKESRKNKIDEYIKFFNMSKIFETFNSRDGDINHDL